MSDVTLKFIENVPGCICHPSNIADVCQIVVSNMQAEAWIIFIGLGLVFLGLCAKTLCRRLENAWVERLCNAVVYGACGMILAGALILAQYAIKIQ